MFDNNATRETVKNFAMQELCITKFILLIHFLVFAVKLPELLVHADIEEEALLELQKKLVDFLKCELCHFLFSWLFNSSKNLCSAICLLAFFGFVDMQYLGLEPFGEPLDYWIQASSSFLFFLSAKKSIFPSSKVNDVT